MEFQIHCPPLREAFLMRKPILRRGAFTSKSGTNPLQKGNVNPYVDWCICLRRLLSYYCSTIATLIPVLYHYSGLASNRCPGPPIFSSFSSSRNSDTRNNEMGQSEMGRACMFRSGDVRKRPNGSGWVTDTPRRNYRSLQSQQFFPGHLFGGILIQTLDKVDLKKIQCSMEPH